MIRGAILAALCCTGPAFAQTAVPMSAETCRQGWQAFNELTNQSATITAVQPDVTADSWCWIDETNAELKPQDFTELDWRAEGVEQAVAQQGVPVSLEVAIAGIDPVAGFKLDLPGGAPDLAEMRLDFRRDPATLGFALNDWTTDFGALGKASFRLEGGGIDLGSLKAMQTTWGGLRVHDARAEIRTTPALGAAFLGDLPLDAARSALPALPEASVDPESRAALAAFLAQGPSVGGTLELTLRSENGLGLLQAVAGGRRIEETGPTPAALVEAMEVILSGVTLSIRWTPDR